MVSNEAANFILERGQMAHKDLQEARAEIERLRSVLRAISQLGGENDLVDAWTLARAALEPST